MTTTPIASWMMYGLVVGVLLAAVAAAGEQLLRGAGRPARWIWAAALGLTLALVVGAPRREQRHASLSLSAVASSSRATTATPLDAGWVARVVASSTAIVRMVTRPVRWIVALAGTTVSRSTARWLVTGWALATIALALLFGVVYARFHRARGRWPLADLQGTRVRVAPDAGPAVVGLSRPEIIVPGWLLERSSEEQRLVLVHEREHVAARDPLLLAAACVAAVLIPWHPAVWWMLSRLRLAVELDCDGRVLRGGVAPRSYGTLLIDLAGQCSGLRIGAPALADESSHLQQRLVAMTRRNVRLSPARIAVATTIAAVALLAACEAKLPTQSEVNDMTAASAANVARRTPLLSKDTADVQYQLNGAFVSAAEANAIAPQRIASIEVTKGPSAPNGKGLIMITTRQPGDAAGPMLMRKRISEIDTVASGENLPGRHLDNFKGVILVDGVRVTEAAMQAIAATDIVSVEIIKGPSAANLYNAPEARDGVIRITTKKGAATTKP